MPGRPHFLEERCTGACDRWPIVTSALVVSCIAVFYSNVPLLPYARDGMPERWYAPFAYAFFHVDAFHLWSNVIILFLAGVVFEATETNARLLLTLMVSAPFAAAGQGFASDRGVVGISGVVYAVLVYQVALVVKNCREMRSRPSHPDWYVVTRSSLSSSCARLSFGLVLLVGEIITSQYAADVSYGGHALGAVSGFLLSLSIGSNVVIDACELVVPLAGLCGLIAVVVAIVSTGQYAAAIWSWVAVLATLPMVAREVGRWSQRYALRLVPRLGVRRRGSQFGVLNNAARTERAGNTRRWMRSAS